MESRIERLARNFPGAIEVDPMRSGDLWPEPDMQVLKEQRRDPPILPMTVFGPFWGEWISAAAEGANAPPDYTAIGLLAMSSVLLGNSRWVRPWGEWKEPPVLWFGAVGDPSSSKSPGLDPVLDIVRAIEMEVAADFDLTHRQWVTARESARAEMDRWKSEVKEASKAGTAPPVMPESAVEPPEPVRPRVIVSDSTPEKLGELAAAHPKGLAFFRDELTGWFTSFDKYSGSGSERALWLEAYGGRPYVIDRVKSATPITINHLAIGVLGGIQPARLTDLLNGPEDGLPSRFLWSWPDPIPPEIPKKTAPRKQALDALRRLARLDLGADDMGKAQPRLLTLTDEAVEVFHGWRKSHHSDLVTLTGPLAAAWGKAPGQLIRLALVLEHLWWSAMPDDVPAPKEVSKRAINLAAGMVEGYFKPSAARVYSDSALSEKDRLGATLAKWIVKKKPTRFNARDVRRKEKLAGLKEACKMDMALDALLDADWLREAPSRSGDSSGRQKRNYHVNPRAIGM